MSNEELIDRLEKDISDIILVKNATKNFDQVTSESAAKARSFKFDPDPKADERHLCEFAIALSFKFEIGSNFTVFAKFLNQIQPLLL